MDLRQLEIVKTIAETGSFTAAGQKLRVSQSAVSRQILLLEDELREPVFLRIGRRIRITPAGDALLRMSQRIFDDIKETRAAISDKQQVMSGTIRLVGGMTVCLYVFPELLKEYRRLHPGMEIKVTTGATPRLIKKLRQGTADLALLTLPNEEPDMVTVPVLTEELLLVTDPTHPLAKRRRVVAQDLVRQPFVLFELGSNSRRVIDAFFVKEQIQPRIVCQTENVEILKALVRSGQGITIIPYQAVDREVRSGQLCCMRIVGQPMIRQTGWVYMRANRVPRMIEEMIRTLERVLPKLRTSPDAKPPTSVTVAAR